MQRRRHEILQPGQKKMVAWKSPGFRNQHDTTMMPPHSGAGYEVCLQENKKQATTPAKDRQFFCRQHFISSIVILFTVRKDG